MYTLIRNKLYGSAFPISEDLAGYNETGIELVISLTSSPLDAGMRKSLAAMEIDCLHEPVADFATPSFAQMDRIYSAYCRTVSRGGAVLVHCGAGRGRTGTVLACIAGAEKNLPARTAIKKVRSVRPGAVETSEQEQFVADWLLRRDKSRQRRRK